MTTKTDIRKLIRGGLTGAEAGKLVLQDNWLVDRGKEGFLTEKDMAALKASLKTSRDIDVYNSYIRLYELVDYTLKDAKIYALEAQLYLMWIDKTLDRLLMKAVFNTKDKPDIESDKHTIDTFLSSTKIRIKSFLSILAVMDAISQIVDIDFSEDMRQDYEQIENTVDVFNSDVNILWIYADDWMKDLGLGDAEEPPYQLKTGRMKPTAKSLRYYQERMAMALGANWMKEAVKSLEYEPAEEGSLAQEMADELADELKKRAKEAGDG